MPRHFSESEREGIERLLIDTAKQLFVQYGVQKTTIADITEAAGVGKGTFYLFFKSKGDIFMKAYTEEWLFVHDIIDQNYKNRKGNLSELIIQYIYENREYLLNHPLLSVVYTRNTLALISDQTVSERLKEFRELSDQRLIDIIESWIRVNDLQCHVDSTVISGMMRSLSYLNYHRDEIGEDIFDEVIRKFAEGITYVVKSHAEEK